MATSCTRATATRSAPLELLETVALATGNAFLAMNPARPASTTPLTALAASTARDIFKSQLMLSPASSPALMELSPLKVFVKSVTSDVLLVWAQPPTAFPALLARSSTRADAGLLVLLFNSRLWARTLLAWISALTVSTSSQ